MKTKKKKLMIALSVLLVLGVSLVIWMKQPPVVTETDEVKGQEIAVDDDLLNAIDAGVNGQENTDNPSSEDTLNP
jgi:hypothetical protein